MAEDDSNDDAPAVRRRRPSTFDLLVYRRSGLAEEEATDWLDAGILPYEAEAFRLSGADFEVARGWSRRSVTGQRYLTWVASGADVEEAVDWWRTRGRAFAGPLGTDRAAPRPEALVTTREIADLSGVDPSAVTNWRKRYPDDFPAPRVTGRNPLYAWDAVRSWLEKHATTGPRRPPPPRELDADWWWRRAVTEACAALKPPVARSLVAAVVLVAAHDAALVPGPSLRPPRSDAWRHPTVAGIRDRATEIERTDTRFDGLLVGALAAPEFDTRLLAALAPSLVTAIQAGCSPAGLLDDALAELRLAGRLGTWTTAGALAELIVTMAAPSSNDRVLDPAMGDAELLLWCACAPVPRPVNLAGQETDPAAASIARARFVLRGLPLEWRIGDSLSHDAFDGQRFDLVMLDPPIEGGTPDNWLDYATEHLAPGGRAVVAVPARTAIKSRLADLLESGSVRAEAVVLVPGSARGGTVEPLAVVLLREGEAAGEHVLLVDLRSTRSSTRRQLQPSRVDHLPTDRFPTADVARALERLRAGRTSPPPIGKVVARSRALTQVDRLLRSRDPLASVKPAAAATEQDQVMAAAQRLADLLREPKGLVGEEQLRAALRHLLDRSR